MKRRTPDDGTVCWWQTGCIVGAADLALKPSNRQIHHDLPGALSQDGAASASLCRQLQLYVQV